jgi:hypothetical protein
MQNCNLQVLHISTFPSHCCTKKEALWLCLRNSVQKAGFIDPWVSVKGNYCKDCCRKFDIFMAITIWVLSPICNCKIKSWCIHCCSRTECLCKFVIVCFSLSIIKHTVVGLLKMSVIYAICHVKDSTEELVLFYLSLGNLECCFLAYGIV